MHSGDILASVLKLAPDERFKLAEKILTGLDLPDPEIDCAWLEEAERRLATYRAGQTQGIPDEDIFGPL
ncbi:addiction module protein [Methylolobus aquaticus]